MKRLALLATSLLTALGCATPTSPLDSEMEARAARARAALEAASPQARIPGRIAAN